MFSSLKTCQGRIQVSFFEVNRAHEQGHPCPGLGAGGCVCGTRSFYSCWRIRFSVWRRFRFEVDELMQQCFGLFVVSLRESALGEMLQESRFVGPLDGELLEDCLSFRDAL